MLAYTFNQYSLIKLPTFRSSSSCFCQVFLSWFCLCGYHGCCWAYLYHQSILYQTQVQSYRKFLVALVLTGNGQRDSAVVNYIIGFFVILDVDLRTIVLVWVALSYHSLTVPIIGARGGRGGGGHMLKPSLSVFR